MSKQTPRYLPAEVVFAGLSQRAGEEVDRFRRRLQRAAGLGLQGQHHASAGAFLDGGQMKGPSRGAVDTSVGRAAPKVLERQRGTVEMLPATPRRQQVGQQVGESAGVLASLIRRPVRPIDGLLDAGPVERARTGSR